MFNHSLTKKSKAPILQECMFYTFFSHVRDLFGPLHLHLYD